MRHDWILDVLSDLAAYARDNGMPGLSAEVERTLTLARDEIQVAEDDGLGADAFDPVTLERRWRRPV
ncbi:hypothetical protein E7811_03800 [Aliigemmobacter aestuarii]|uniref:Uncharacterized protein n=1 Tax=Aliigemmobacter aestuarii TaxID=1445661 RepID=A0A4S3MQW0_9RHOB|nr:hypothetical protein [Gemmobacter aestuarii]THD84859.1 hypothetical protein E7811_03800 [Gemmobacter aestuarii]